MRVQTKKTLEIWPNWIAMHTYMSRDMRKTTIWLLLIRKFSRGFYFRETSHMRSFMKIKSSRNGKITLSTTDKGKSYPSHEIFRSQVCLLTLFTKIKFTQNFRIYSMCHEKTQISLGSQLSLIRVLAVSMKKAWVLSY